MSGISQEQNDGSECKKSELPSRQNGEPFESNVPFSEGYRVCEQLSSRNEAGLLPTGGNSAPDCAEEESLDCNSKILNKMESGQNGELLESTVPFSEEYPVGEQQSAVHETVQFPSKRIDYDSIVAEGDRYDFDAKVEKKLASTQNGELLESTAQNGELLELTTQNDELFELTTQNGELLESTAQNGELFELTTQNGELFELTTQNGELLKSTTENGEFLELTQNDELLKSSITSSECNAMVMNARKSVQDLIEMYSSINRLKEIYHLEAEQTSIDLRKSPNIRHLLSYCEKTRDVLTSCGSFHEKVVDVLPLYVVSDVRLQFEFEQRKIHFLKNLASTHKNGISMIQKLDRVKHDIAAMVPLDVTQPHNLNEKVEQNADILEGVLGYLTIDLLNFVNEVTQTLKLFSALKFYT